MLSRKFLGISEELGQQIISGRFEVGTYLPSEPQLAKEYDVSRETIRKALNVLTQAGMIQKIRGKGSLVLGNPVTSSNIFKGDELVLSSRLSLPAMERIGKVVEFSKTVCNVTSFIHDPNESVGKIPCFKVGQVYYRKKAPALLRYDYIFSDLLPDLDETVITDNMVDFLTETLGVPLGFIKREIVIELADYFDAERLDIQPGDALGVIKEKFYLNDSRLVMLSAFKYVAHDFRYNDFIKQ